MTPQQYSTMLGLLVLPPLVAEIVKSNSWGEIEATEKLYHSKLYAQLAKEELKLWHYSPLTLCTMFNEEQRARAITYPEEAC